MIEISEQTINRIHAVLHGVKDADKKVLKPALTRGLMAGKTQAGKVARENYRISKQDFDRYGYLQYNGMTQSGNDIIGSFKYSGRPIALMKYKVTPNSPKYHATPSAAVLKSSSLVAFGDEKNVFVAQMKSGHIGIFERQEGKYSKRRGKKRNKHTEKIRELLSPSVPQMVGNEQSIKTIEDRVREVINNRIDHEIGRLLDKNGG